MVKCHLSKIMGENKLKISELSEATGINRGTLTRLYKENFTRIDMEVVDKLCEYFDISVCDLFEHIK